MRAMPNIVLEKLMLDGVPILSTYLWQISNSYELPIILNLELIQWNVEKIIEDQLEKLEEVPVSCFLNQILNSMNSC